jgi:rfaE bifunctional protein nucleotidyltransferase chain/domain
MGARLDKGDMASFLAARTKIKELSELGRLSEEGRQVGKRIVLAHGTFDLLHLGHVRYLEEARRQGDILIVTITADTYVNKGPGRPIFSEHLRAEMVGALDCVDWVAVNHAPTAVNIITLLKPDVYVKGQEYKVAENDVTGKIVDESRAVEAHGGRVHFSDDIVFSSSSLINRYLDVSDPEVRAYLDNARSQGFMERVPALLDKIADKRVLFVGETIIDEYAYVSALGKPSKEPVLATLLQNREMFAGGVIAAANHAASFCREVEIVTCLGAGDEGYGQLVKSSLRPNVRLTPFVLEGAPTTHKRRYVDADYFRKLFEVYNMNDAPLPPRVEAEIIDHIARYARDFDVVVVTDFGHGMMSSALREALISHSPFLALNAQSNAGNYGFNLITKYRRADYVCIDAPEARLAMADKAADLMEIAADGIHKYMSADRLILTHGRNGCVVFDKRRGVAKVPAFTRRILDTMGAGDAFLAVTAPLAKVADDMEVVGFIGNIVGSIKVGILGHREFVMKSVVLKYLQALLK